MGYNERIGYPFYGKDKEKLRKFLADQDLDYDESITYSYVLEDNNEIIATGSAYKNIIKCIAVSPDYQGQNLLAEIITKLMNHFIEEGITHYFGFTKPKNKAIFGNMGLYPVAETDNVLLLENRRGGLDKYIKKLQKETDKAMDTIVENEQGEGIGAIVANCNPFTFGHRYLMENAAKDCRLLHVFVLADDNQMFSEKDRFEMVKQGTADIKNIILHRASDYMISPAVFPTYFIKDKVNAYKMNCELDIKIFGEKITKALGITKRYVGTEPHDRVTNDYNECLEEQLPTYGIQFCKIERLTSDDLVISASTVRKALESLDIPLLRRMIPESTASIIHVAFDEGEIGQKKKKVQIIDGDKKDDGKTLIEKIQEVEKSGDNFVITTIRTPASLREVTKNVTWKLPAIVMDGAGIFNMESAEFLLTYQMSAAQAKQISAFLDERGYKYFVNVVEDNHMAIYYDELQNEIQKAIYYNLNESRHYKNERYPEQQNVVYFMLVDEKEKMQALYEEIMKQEWIGDYKAITYPSTDYPGYDYIKIYHKAANVPHMLENIKAMFDLDIVENV